MMAMACYDYFAERNCSSDAANCFNFRRRESTPAKNLLLLVYKLSQLAGAASSMSCSSEMTRQ